MYSNKSIEVYLRDLAAKLPAPGGGAAAALTASMGAALISMVVNFTLGKPKYAQYEEELKVILDKSENFRKKFLSLVDEDVLAYKSKNTATSLRVPHQVCDFCVEASLLCKPLLAKSNRNLISDVAVAAILLEAGFTSAYFNVEINLRTIADKNIVSVTRRKLLGKQKIIRKIRQKTEEAVGKIIRG